METDRRDDAIYVKHREKSDVHFVLENDVSEQVEKICL